MESVFYRTFERHDHGEGLKGHATHYCAGCGHGLVHKYLAEAIDELGIQDRTIAISPVGCAVFLYYYLDVGNSQAAHGRAPAVAIGHKMANPESIVVSYQGDGDLASIGLAEIMQLAQIGIPITVIFVNNAIYAMTGGQMAPTTLMAQATTTSPAGRDRLMGEPLRVAELIAGLDGPVYVERVALFNNKQRTRAHKAIKKGLKLQMENKGFSLIEVLSECPTHLKITPEENEKWVEEYMVRIYPLGVKKDETDAEPWFDLGQPNFEPEPLLEAIGSTDEPVERFGDGFPAHLDADDVALKFAGAGGDGAQTIANLTCMTAINERFDVLSPAAPAPHVLVAFNAPSLEKFGPTVQHDGTILYDETVIATPPKLDPSIRMIGIPFTRIAHDLGTARVKNVVALGALQAATKLFPPESFLEALRHVLHDKCALLELNEEAFALGGKAVAAA